MSSTSQRLESEKERLKADAHRGPRELEREADLARAEVEHTLEALERRLSPGELLDHGLKLLRGNGMAGDFGRNLTNQVRNNPLPLVLTGVGLTWLIAASDRPPAEYHRPSTEPGIADKARAAAARASAAAASVQSAATHAADATRSAAQQGSAMAGGARRQAADLGRSVADASRAGAHNAWEGYDYLRREQPLVLGALAVAAGALLGALLPGSETEDRYLGEYRDETLDRVEQEVRRTADQVAESATASGAAESSEREPGRPMAAGTRPADDRTAEVPSDEPPESSGGFVV